MTTHAEIGIRIATARKERGLLQQEVGKMLAKQRSHAAISDIERGRTRIDLELLGEIATLLDVPLMWFLEPLETRQVYVPPKSVPAVDATDGAAKETT